jgi:predicted dehydrogenase
MMDTQNIMNMITIAAIGAGGWFGRELWGAVKDLRKDLHEVEVDLPKSYVSKLDMDKRMDHIEGMFQRIYDKLDGKADK